MFLLCTPIPISFETSHSRQPFGLMLDVLFDFIYIVEMQGAMASSHPADSKTVFAARLAELELSSLKPKFDANGWFCFADFAMACSDMNGRDPALFKTDVLDPLLGEDKSKIPRVRRLYVQAYTAHAQMIEKMNDPAPERPLTMHPLDRDARTTDLKTRIRGFKLLGDSEPSFALINRMTTILNNGIVSYEGWEKLTSRDQEVNCVTAVPGMRLVTGTDGAVTFVAIPDAGPSTDLNGELRWDLALRRRGLAMDIAGLCSWESHMEWHEQMKFAYLEEPPPTYCRPDWVQLLQADRKLWTRVATACAASCKAKPGSAVTNFEEIWLNLIQSQEIKHYLLPRHGGSTSSSSSSSAVPPQSHGPDKVVRRLENELAKARKEILQQKRRVGQMGNSDVKGKGKGKNRNDKRLRNTGGSFLKDFAAKGNVTRTKEGTNICFNYNLPSGCSAAAPGQRCPKGLHVCSHPNCQSKATPHSATTH